MDRNPRWKLIRRIRYRITKGDYEDPRILAIAVDRILEKIRSRHRHFESEDRKIK